MSIPTPIYVTGYGDSGLEWYAKSQGVDVSHWVQLAWNDPTIATKIAAAPEPREVVGESFGGHSAILACAAAGVPIASLLLIDPVNHNMCCGANGSGGPMNNLPFTISDNVAECVCVHRDVKPDGKSCPYSSPIVESKPTFHNVVVGTTEPTQHVSPQFGDPRSIAAMKLIDAGQSILPAFGFAPAAPQPPHTGGTVSTGWTAANGRALLNGVPDPDASNVLDVFQVNGQWVQHVVNGGAHQLWTLPGKGATQIATLTIGQSSTVPIPDATLQIRVGVVNNAIVAK